MRNVILMLLVAFVLAGCPTHVVSSDDRRVVVESQSLDVGEAQKFADAECAKNRQAAKMTSKAGYWDRNYVFECIPDSSFNKTEAINTANKATPQQLPSSKAEVIDTSSKATPQRFRDLQTLRNEGLITDEEYQQKRKQLMEHL